MKCLFMFQSVTWQQYAGFLGFSLLLYYIFIGYLYYKIEVLSLFGISIISDKEKHSIVFTKTEQDEKQTSLFNSLCDELQAYISSLKHSSIKQETLTGLGYILNKYPAKLIVNSTTQLQQLIITECNNNSVTCPEKEELDMLWKQAQ
jgi:hypothetical protein